MQRDFKVDIPSNWSALLSIDDLEAIGASKRPTGVDINVNDPGAFRDDCRVLVTLTPDETIPEVIIEVRLCSGDTNYFVEVVLFDDGHEEDSAVIDLGGDVVVLVDDGGETYTVTPNWSAHEHKWGPVERSHITGTPNRKCQVPGCGAITLDLDDDDEVEDDPEVCPICCSRPGQGHKPDCTHLADTVGKPGVHESIPADFEVQPLKPGQEAGDKATCGHCGLSWDDSIPTSYTPAPSGRCPFEAFHIHPEAKPEPSVATDEGFDQFLDDATHRVADLWHDRGGVMLDSDQLYDLNDLLEGFFQDKDKE